jgi:hypothetical protein
VREIEESEFDLKPAGRFKPKGKSELMSVYRLPWEEFRSIIDGIEPGSYLPVLAKQKAAIFAGVGMSLFIAYLFFLRYMRYLTADAKAVAALTLNPDLIISEYPAVPVVLGLVVVAFIVVVWRVHALSHFTLKLLNGGLGFALGYLLVFVPFIYFGLDYLPAGHEVLYESRHLFVEVFENNSPVYAEPSETAEVLRTVGAGNILLQVDSRNRGGLSWNKVYLGEEGDGWMVRVQPPKLGVPETRVTYADKFYFKLRDVYALLLGCFGFIWGFWQFRIRPV